MKCVIYTNDPGNIQPLQEHAKVRGWEVTETIVEQPGTVSLSAGIAMGNADTVLFKDAGSLVKMGIGFFLDFLIGLNNRGTSCHFLDNPELSTEEHPDLGKALIFIRGMEIGQKISSGEWLTKREGDNQGESTAEDLRKAGHTYNQIAGELGISLAKAYRLCNVGKKVKTI